MTTSAPGYLSGSVDVRVGAVYVDPPGDDARHAAFLFDTAPTEPTNGKHLRVVAVFDGASWNPVSTL